MSAALSAMPGAAAGTAARIDPFALVDPVSLDSSSTAILRARPADVATMFRLKHVRDIAGRKLVVS